MHEPISHMPNPPAIDPMSALQPVLRLAAPSRRAVFQGGEDARAAATSGGWKPGFPNIACRAATDAMSASLWMGPDEFLLLSPNEISFGSALAGIAHSLVEVSHRQSGFELFGARSAGLLNGGCPLDLDIGSFPVGMCTRTVFAKADIFLWRKAEDVFHFEVWRSFVDYTIRLLAEIARG